MTAEHESEETPVHQNAASEQLNRENATSPEAATFEPSDINTSQSESVVGSFKPQESAQPSDDFVEQSKIQADESKTTGIDAAFASEDSGAVDVQENKSAASLIDLLSMLDRKLSDLHGLFETKFVDDSFKELFIKQMHAELQEYKQDVVGQKLKPLLASVIQLHTETSRTYERLTRKQADEIPANRLLSVVEGIQDDVEILLAQHGIEPFVEPGDYIKPTHQKAVQTWKVEDVSLFGKIVARHGPGFRMGDTVLRKEPVEVYAGFTAPGRQDVSSGNGIEAQQSKPAGEDS